MSGPDGTGSQHANGMDALETRVAQRLQSQVDDRLGAFGHRLDTVVQALNQLTTACGENGAKFPDPADIAPSGNRADNRNRSRHSEEDGDSEDDDAPDPALRPNKHTGRGKGPGKPKGTKAGKGSKNACTEESSDEDKAASAKSRSKPSKKRQDSSSEFEFSESDSEPENRARGNRRKHSSLPGISQFKFGETSANWTSWIEQFKNTVRGHLAPRDKAELHKLSLRLLPAYLNPLAHDVYTNCKHKNDWKKLVAELEEAFEDPEIKQNWKTDLRAYKWDGSTPLHVYKGNIMRYVNKYDTELRVSEEALKVSYYTRFVAGLPEDYRDFIDQQLYEGKHSIDRALRSAQKFRSVKSRKQEREAKEVSAGVTFESTNAHERLRALEQGIEKINTHINSGRAHSGERYPPQRGQYPRAQYQNQGARPRDNGYGRGGGYSRDSSYSRERYGRDQQNRGRPQFRQDQWNTRERLERFRNRQGGSNPQPQGSGSADAGNPRSSSQPTQPNPYVDYRRKKEEGAAGGQPYTQPRTEEAGMLQSETESGPEFDATMAAFQEWRDDNEEEEFERFQAAKAETENF